MSGLPARMRGSSAGAYFFFSCLRIYNADSVGYTSSVSHADSFPSRGSLKLRVTLSAASAESNGSPERIVTYRNGDPSTSLRMTRVFYKSPLRKGFAPSAREMSGFAAREMNDGAFVKSRASRSVK